MTALMALLVAGGLDCVAADAQRVQHHLLATEAALRANPPTTLSDAQRDARARNLDRLHGYAVGGRFPRNPDLPAATPFFIDAAGTRCAMAALIEAEGGADFVRRIARTRNNARIAELVDEPELVAWLEANGMTAAEAARIQPSYYECREWRVNAFCQPRSATLQLLATRIEDGGLYGVVERIAGGDGGIQVGDERLFLDVRVLAQYAPQFLPDVVPGRRYLAAVGTPSVLFVDADGGAYYALDRHCSERPTLDWSGSVSLLGLDLQQCRETLTARDVRFRQPFCFLTPGEHPDFCLEDGGVDPALMPAIDAGAAATDAGPLLGDGGAVVAVVDAGNPSRADAGALDGGEAASPVPTRDAGSADAGSVQATGPVGCGCNSGAGVSAWAWVGWVLAWRMRRRG